MTPMGAPLWARRRGGRGELFELAPGRLGGQVSLDFAPARLMAVNVL